MRKTRIIRTRKHSAEKLSKENVWYFSEDRIISAPPIPENKSGKPDTTNEIREDYDPFMTKVPAWTKLKKECDFVVDWQMSDSL